MSAKKFYYLLVVAIALCALLTLGGAYMGTTMMKKSSIKLVQTKLDNIGYDAEEQNFMQARKDLEKYRPLNDVLQKILPKQKDQALAVRELYKIADETGMVIDVIQFPPSTLGQKTTATKQTGTTSTGVTQAKAVDGMPGVMGIDINVTMKDPTSYDNMIRFLQKVELNRRSMQIKSITVGKDSKTKGVIISLTITIFVKP